MGIGHHHHHHHHDDSHPILVPADAGHAEERARERRKLTFTIVAAFTILIAEVIGGWIAHSLALLSDAGHMFSDVVAQILSLLALMLASRPADARRTYGWYRLEILAALANGVALVALSFGILWSAAHRIREPHEIHTEIVMAIAAIGLTANVIGAWLLHDAKNLNVKGAYLHVLGDTFSSAAVLVGGAIMFFVKGWYWLDPALSILIGLFILVSSFSLIREAVDVLLETVPRNIDLAGVTEAVKRIDGVSDVHDLHIWTITSGMFALSAHNVVAAGHAEHNDVLLNKVKEVLMREFKIAHTTLQLESEDYEHVGHVC